jgi:transcriptional regulator with XRE-family HTH domain
MAQVKHNQPAARKPAATNDRNFRTFLLVRQFEAEAIGARIALARKEAGLTQQELAEMASFSKRSLQDYEAGNTIPYPHMQELSALLKREVPWFLHGEQDEEALDRIEKRLAAVEDLLDEVLGLLRDPSQEPAESQ